MTSDKGSRWDIFAGACESISCISPVMTTAIGGTVGLNKVLHVTWHISYCSYLLRKCKLLYLQQHSPRFGFYLTVSLSWHRSCFSLARFMIALIARCLHLMARIFEWTNTCCGLFLPLLVNSPYWHDEFDKSSYRPGRQLKRMWQGSLSPLSSCSASFRSHLSPLWISYF